MKHRLSASRLGMARRCLYWARPDAVWPARETSSEASLGIAVHRAVQEGIGTESSVDLFEYAGDLEDAQVDSLERIFAQWAMWWPKERGNLRWRAEVAVAWDVRTGKARILPPQEHRNYGDLADDEVPGTVDAFAEDGDAVRVIDWKTGRSAIEAPATNAQLGHNGAALATVLGKSEALVQYAKLGEDTIGLPGYATLDVFSFEATRDELRTMVDAVPNAEPVPGPWCNWCPAKGACPETAITVENVIEATSLIRRPRMSLQIENDEHAAGLLIARDAALAFLDELGKALRNYADAHHGIPLPDGTIFEGKQVTTERPDLSAPGALHAIYELGLTDAVKSSTTWADIKRAGGKEAEKAARERLKQLGAIKASTYPRYEARPAKKDKSAA